MNNVDGSIRCMCLVAFTVFSVLSRESDHSAERTHSGVASHLSTTLRWVNPAKAFPIPNNTTSK